MANLWAAEWRSKNILDGETKHIIYNNDTLPALFRTQRKCREYIKERYGYIKTRRDLRVEPHGWRTPQPIKVIIIREY